MIATTLLMFGLAGFSAVSIEVSNFMSGKICLELEGKPVCRQEEDIVISGEGTCVWAGEKKPCTWFGFQFDYKIAQDETAVECEWETSRTTTSGDIEEVLETNTTSGSYTIELEASKGHYIHYQYHLYKRLPAGQNLVTTTTDCSVGGTRAFNMTHHFIFPVF